MSVSNENAPEVNVDVPCPSCGEMSRKGSVRCRECGAFLDPNTERLAQEGMGKEDVNLADFDLADEVEEGDDFEVAPGVTTFEATESTFDLRSNSPSSTVDEDYSLTDDPLAEEGAEGAEAAAGPAGDSGDAGESAEGTDAKADPLPPGGSSGDALLDGAMVEELEALRRSMGRVVKVNELVPGQGVVVYCPSGHRIHVADKFRGRTGRCPQCRAPFLVPGTPPAGALDDTEDDDGYELLEDSAERIIFESDKYGRFTTWMPNVRLHRVNISKLRLKAGSLADESELVDIGFSDDAMLLVTVFKGKGGMTNKAALRKKPAIREKVRDALVEAAKRPDPGELPAPYSQYISKGDFEKIWIAQPALPLGESLFADLNLFGDGVIGIRLPSVEGSDERLYITPTLSQYRRLVLILAEKFQVVLASEPHGIPLMDQSVDKNCTVNGKDLKILQHVEFYKTDPNIELELIGRECVACGIVISESARRMEKLGGKTGSGIAKVKCPACEQKLGDKPVYRIKPADPTGLEAEEPES
ncbi:hypothetical protein [Symmachiella dynata]|uniref:hypothetical protein n=1 Tax=Symmachiella dynata TaxID=2527995 RepID=UPI0030ED765B